MEKNTQVNESYNMSFEQWNELAEGLTIHQFIYKYLDSVEERVMFKYVWSIGAQRITLDDFAVLAQKYDLYIGDLERAMAILKHKNLVSAIPNFPHHYVASITCKN